jgi:hypothetical protein
VLVVLWFVARPLLLGRGIDVFDVVWALFISSFMWAGASAAIRGGQVLEALGRVPLRQVLRPVVAVSPSQTIGSVHGEPGSTVVVLDERGVPYAVVAADDVRQVPSHLWATTPVSAVCRPQPAGWAVAADPAGDIVPVVVALQEARVPEAVVLHLGRPVGAVRAVDVNEVMDRN